MPARSAASPRASRSTSLAPGDREGRGGRRPRATLIGEKLLGLLLRPPFVHPRKSPLHAGVGNEAPEIGEPRRDARGDPPRPRLPALGLFQKRLLATRIFRLPTATLRARCLGHLSARSVYARTLIAGCQSLTRTLSSHSQPSRGA